MLHGQPASNPVRLVVLGTRGFVARAVTTHAAELGWNVLACSASDLDLTDRASVDRLATQLTAADTIVMTSALTPDRGKDLGTMTRNLAMAEHVCAALEKQPCAHVVYVGSDAVYDDAETMVRESSQVNPSSLHGVMHFTREQMFVHTCGRLRIALARLRPSLLFGPGDTHNGYGPNRFARAAVFDGRIALFGNGEEQRDHVFIDDVSRVIAEVARRRSDGVLNMATGRSCSFRRVAELIASRAGRPVRIEPSARANPVVHRHFDVTGLIAHFPHMSLTPLEAGLDRTVAALSTRRG